MTYGARNLRRLIQKELEDAIATRIINSYANPVTKIHISIADQKIVLDAQ